MTATMPITPDGPSGVPPGQEPPSGGGAPPPRLLRRSRTDRYAVGVCGGLGRYFDIDPVIFRVVLAVLALFGGAGIALYLLLWLSIPEEGTVDAPLDRAIAELRRRRIPFGLVAAGAIVVLWALGFSWWSPHSLLPALLVAAIVVVVVSRRAPRPADTVVVPAVEAPPPISYDMPVRSGGSQLREWMSESRERSRRRRRRSWPIRVSVLVAAVLAVAVLAIVDAVHGIPLVTYFWTVGAIVLAGLLVGLITRRTPWSTILLLVPVTVGLLVLGSSSTSIHDGYGTRLWQPQAASDVARTYKLSMGEATLDLSRIGPTDAARPIRVRLGMGHLRLIVPRDLPVQIHVKVRSGEFTVQGTRQDDGVGLQRDYVHPASAPSPRWVIDTTLTAGQISVTFSG